MFQLYLLVLFTTLLVHQSAAQQGSALCIKGCCGLQLELPSQLLSFSNPTAQGSQAAINVHHPNAGIPCCECRGGAESPASVHGEEDAAPVVGSTVGNKAHAANSTEQLLMHLNQKDVCWITVYGPGCELGCLERTDCPSAKKSTTSKVQKTAAGTPPSVQCWRWYVGPGCSAGCLISCDSALFKASTAQDDSHMNDAGLGTNDEIHSAPMPNIAKDEL